jgi:tRNA A-37 threonylcarbamoyl transferase component Bud32/tetratricopeptide (TPR) repeat protein
MADNTSERNPIDLLAEEFAQRCRLGATPSIDEYVAKYPQWADDIRMLFPPVAMMEELKRKRGAPTVVKDTSGTVPKLEQIGDFKIVREVGRGGMGIVYEAQQVPLARRVALKVLPQHSLLDETRLERFRREAKAAAQLHHTNIVPVFGNGENDGLHYYVMQYIDGKPLNTVLIDLRNKVGSERPPVPLPRTGNAYWRWVANIGVQVAEALHHAHRQGTLHRDIKPANIILDLQGAAWVTDFGLAKLASHDDLTQTGDIIGTLQYMAPETLQNKADARSDLYSLGLVLFELLTLRQPFGESSAAGMIREMDSRELKNPRSINPEIPRDLENIVLKAGSHAPEQRYASAADLAGDLRRFLDDRPVVARAVGPVERLARWCRRNRVVTGLTIAVAASLVLALIVGWVGYVKTTGALARETEALGRESQRRADADVAKKRAEENVQMCLLAFEQIFNKLEPNNGPMEGSIPFEPQPMEPGNNGPFDKGRPGDRPSERPRRPVKESKENLGLLQSVLNFYDTFAAKNETNASLQFEAAKAFSRVGDIQKQLGAFDKAEAAYQRAVSNIDALRAIDPKNIEYLSFSSRMYSEFALALSRVQKPGEAEKRHRQAIEAGRLVLAQDSRDPRNLLDLNHSRLCLADFLLKQHRASEARPLVEESIGDLKPVAKSMPRARPLLGTAFHGLAAVLESIGDDQGAQKAWEDAREFSPPPPRPDDPRQNRPRPPPGEDEPDDGPGRPPPPPGGDDNMDRPDSR